MGSNSNKRSREPNQHGLDLVKRTNVAPMADFQKKPNSEVRYAIPLGFFPGKSKQVYDVLYSLTRAAISPKRTVEISRRELRRRSGVGAMVTIDKALAKLVNNGLITKETKSGHHQGNLIEVFIFEEISPEIIERVTSTRIPSTTRPPSPTHILGNLDDLESRLPSTSSEPIKTGNPGDAKTLFKNSLNHDDDDECRKTVDRIRRECYEVTRREMNRKEWEGFNELLDVIRDVTSPAVARTDFVSVYWKFAAANLRQRAFPAGKKEKARLFDPGREGPSEVVIEDEEPVQPWGDRLPEKLAELRKMAAHHPDDPEYIKCYRPCFTDEDWESIIQNLYPSEVDIEGRQQNER